MKRTFFFALTFVLLVTLLVQAEKPSQVEKISQAEKNPQADENKETGTVIVIVTGIDVKAGGTIKIGIYNDESRFPAVDGETQGADIEVKNSELTYTFEKLPAGKYAIAIFQDENDDGKLNTNLFGAPKEPYGFSNNKYGMFGPPAYEDVSFDVEAGKSISLTINLE